MLCEDGDDVEKWGFSNIILNMDMSNYKRKALGRVCKPVHHEIPVSRDFLHSTMSCANFRTFLKNSARKTVLPNAYRRISGPVRVGPATVKIVGSKSSRLFSNSTNSRF